MITSRAWVEHFCWRAVAFLTWHFHPTLPAEYVEYEEAAWAHGHAAMDFEGWLAARALQQEVRKALRGQKKSPQGR